jgi:hypothetical protein
LRSDIAARDDLEKWSRRQGYVIATSHRSKGPVVDSVFIRCCYATSIVLTADLSYTSEQDVEGGTYVDSNVQQTFENRGRSDVSAHVMHFVLRSLDRVEKTVCAVLMNHSEGCPM